MSVLIAKFDQLTLNTEENEKNILYGYICKVKSSKNYFACENDFYVVPDQSGSKFILCERKYLLRDTVIICHNCKTGIAFDNIKNVHNVNSLKEEYCPHAKLSELLFEPKPKERDLKLFDGHYIEILSSEKQSIALVHPSTENGKTPGIIVVNSRSTKPKCHTCKGFKCLHANIYMEEASVDKK